MHRTIFTTPVVRFLLRSFSLIFMKLAGWKVEGRRPSESEQCVLIAAPHTSNWDLPFTLMVAFILNLNLYWMGKQSIFTPPFGAIMKWLGGIPVDRSKSTNLVADSSKALLEADGPVHLVVPPEGTRSKVRYWKTGFYYIALSAKVPIVLAYMDYQQKRAGIGPTLMPSGDIEKDMLVIKAFYAQFKGKNADQFEST
jgi:1-acyl-sn-glycerol-3-phosphate acyltransferase